MIKLGPSYKVIGCWSKYIWLKRSLTEAPFNRITTEEKFATRFTDFYEMVGLDWV
jgi:hypothetical protein